VPRDGADRRTHPTLHVPTVLLEGGVVTTEPTRSINQSRVRSILGEAAAGCGGALNAFFVAVGDTCGLYPTGQYSSDGQEPDVRSQAPIVVHARNSNQAADGPVHARGSAIPSSDRAMRVQLEETAFMTLICHDCAATTPSRKARA
jgi:hypothetical protein